ncbi:hypothetical protein GCM10023230_16180 [Flavobacterium hankyongi]|uniref:Uncharacterized protein n=1 Tax=Flavobacterium hankyongi TaxID=1176532 RepID=A0ABP8ZV84_9FLAO
MNSGLYFLKVRNYKVTRTTKFVKDNLSDYLKFKSYLKLIKAKYAIVVLGKFFICIPSTNVFFGYSNIIMFLFYK